MGCNPKGRQGADDDFLVNDLDFVQLNDDLHEPGPILAVHLTVQGRHCGPFIVLRHVDDSIETCLLLPIDEFSVPNVLYDLDVRDEICAFVRAELEILEECGDYEEEDQ
jgi:hypothetical protein